MCGQYAFLLLQTTYDDENGAGVELENRRYHTLDGMRGIAALLVVLYHVGPDTANPVPSGYLAVDFFFALSGFVVAAAYAEKLRAGLSFRRFCEIRVIRLYPLYAIGLALGVLKEIVGYVTHDPRVQRPAMLAVGLVLAIFMMPNPFYPRELYRFNGPSWSIFYELVINVAFAAALFKASARLLAGLAVASGLVIIFWVWPALNMNVGWAWNQLPVGLARVGFSFPIGMLIWRAFGGRGTRATWLALAPAAALAALLALRLGAGEQLFTAIVISPVLLILGARWDVPMQLRKASAYLGDISYPIYATHFPLILVIRKLATKLHLGYTGSIVLTLLLSIALGTVLAFIDQRVRNEISRRLQVRRSAVAQAMV